MLTSLNNADSPLRRAIDACRSYFVAAGLFSLAMNLLYLAAPLYMLQVYDRVVSSGSVTTLVMLTIVVLGAFAALAGLDAVRSRILARAGARIDRLLSGPVVAAILSRQRGEGARSQPLRDFDTLRQFIAGGGVHALFDLPWAPIYIAVIFLLHPFLGLFALAAAAALILLAIANERMVRKPLTEANEAVARNYAFAETSLRNAEVVNALGMGEGLIARFRRDRDRVVDRQLVAADRAATIASLIKFMRMTVQSVILGLGAWLAVERLVTVGAIFAASILLGRALQPVEQLVGSWRTLISALTAYRRVEALLQQHHETGPAIALPRPRGRVNVENLHHAPPGSIRHALRGVTFGIEPGELVGIIGPSGTGKTTLARHLVGVLIPAAGSVRLDGASIAAWPKAGLGRFVGYLPQDIELFADTVAANISRFQAGNDEAVIAAAKLAGIHEMILRLANGYETEIGESGAVLSGGYRQRIALARAVYGDPSLVVLDEPSSNLDPEGDAALAECLRQLKTRGTTVIVISHRPATISAVDKILVLRDGTVEAFDDRAVIFNQLVKPPEPRPMRIVEGQGGRHDR